MKPTCLEGWSLSAGQGWVLIPPTLSSSPVPHKALGQRRHPPTCQNFAKCFLDCGLVRKDSESQGALVQRAVTWDSAVRMPLRVKRIFTVPEHSCGWAGQARRGAEEPVSTVQCALSSQPSLDGLDRAGRTTLGNKEALQRPQDVGEDIRNLEVPPRG